MDIFVAKLSSDTNPDHLTELFGQYGNVVSAKVIMDKETGKSKCYGFVEMDNDAEGDSAIEHLNDSNFMGNYIIVKKSEPRAQEKRSFDRRPSGGGGFGGGNRRPEGNNRRFDRNGSREGGSGGDRRNFNRDRDRDRNFNRYNH